MKIILLSHIIACSWFTVARLEKSLMDEGNSWITRVNLQRGGEAEMDLHW